jgi:hypothetical protein
MRFIFSYLHLEEMNAVILMARAFYFISDPTIKFCCLHTAWYLTCLALHWIFVKIEQAKRTQLFSVNGYNSFYQVRDSKPAIKLILPTGIQHSTMELYISFFQAPNWITKSSQFKGTQGDVYSTLHAKLRHSVLGETVPSILFTLV